VGNNVTLPKLATPESAKIGSQNSLLRRYVGGEKGPLSEEISEIAVRELVKLQLFAESVTLLADWWRVDPGSEALRALLAELRRRPPVRNHITQEKLMRMGRLFGEKPLMYLQDSQSLRRARWLSESYLTHYYHAVPFDRSVLRAAWGNCLAKGCSKAQDQLERRIGKIGAPRRGEIPQRGSGIGSPVPDEATGSVDLSGSPESG
jgi:hypothetical protein